MSDTKKLFIESVLYNAAKMTGDTTGIMPELEKIKTILEVDIKDIAENNRRLQLKELETEKEKAAETLAALGKAYTETEPGKRQDIIAGIQREYETLKKTANTATPIITSREIMQTHFEPRQWIVENLITTGLTILSGAPKIGKSWLLFALAEAASTGGNFLDHYTVNKTSVLHLSLEDTPRTIKERREILADKQRGGFSSGNDKLFIATQWDTGPSGLENYLRAHNEIKLVIVDTLGRFMPDIEDMNDYAATVKALAGIKRIADTLDIAILVVHHAKKGGSKEKDWMEQSLGSQGIVGSADTIIILQREIENTGERKNTGKFYATGRSIKDVFHNVKFSPDLGMWGVTNKEPEPPKPPTGKGKKPPSKPYE